MTHELERVARISFHKGEEARSVESSTDTDRAETVFVWEEEKNGLAVINDSIVYSRMLDPVEDPSIHLRGFKSRLSHRFMFQD